MSDVESTRVDLLSRASAAGYLRGRGLVASDEEVAVTELAGGVSNLVLGVRAGGRGMVLKQSLPRLRVRDEWLADQRRILMEAVGLREAARITPGNVPEVYDVDADAFVMVLQRAPDAWQDWKSQLLAEQVDPGVAAALGTVLARWQAATATGGLPGELDDREPFRQLRIDPFHRTVASRRPELAPMLERLATALLTERHCLVHGDFSPKNVLVGDDGLWVLDFEVTHVGHRAFDPAFLLAHLLLKAVHRPASLPHYRACAEAFAAAYGGGLGPEPAPVWPTVLAHTGALVLARVHGKSPAGYLDADEDARASALGERLLREPPRDPPAAFGCVPEVA